MEEEERRHVQRVGVILRIKWGLTKFRASVFAGLNNAHLSQTSQMHQQTNTMRADKILFFSTFSFNLSDTFFLKHMPTTHTCLFLMDILCFHRRDEHSSHLQAFNLTHTLQYVWVHNIIASWFTPYLYTSSSTLSRFHCSPCDFQHLLSLSRHYLLLFSNRAFQLLPLMKETQSTIVKWLRLCAVFRFYK